MQEGKQQSEAIDRNLQKDKSYERLFVCVLDLCQCDLMQKREVDQPR